MEGTSACAGVWKNTYVCGRMERAWRTTAGRLPAAPQPAAAARRSATRSRTAGPTGLGTAHTLGRSAVCCQGNNPCTSTHRAARSVPGVTSSLQHRNGDILLLAHQHFYRPSVPDNTYTVCQGAGHEPLTLPYPTLPLTRRSHWPQPTSTLRSLEAR